MRKIKIDLKKVIPIVIASLATALATCAGTRLVVEWGEECIEVDISAPIPAAGDSDAGPLSGGSGEPGSAFPGDSGPLDGGNDESGGHDGGVRPDTTGLLRAVREGP